MQSDLNHIYQECQKQTILVSKIGDVNQEFINLLLSEIKAQKDNPFIPYTIYKKIYSVATELLENVKKHAQVISGFTLPKGFITIIFNKDTIVITSANYVSSIDQKILSNFFEGLVGLNIQEKYQETIFRNKMLTLKGGASIGLLDIASKVNKRLDVSFYENQYEEKIVKFTAKLNVMEKLVIKSEETTPEINFDHSTLTLSVSGESRPEDIKDFYQNIFNWITQFEAYIHYVSSISPKAVNSSLIFNLTYFNSSSVKIFIQIMELYKKIEKNNSNFIANIIWKYNTEDEDILEAGQEIEKMTGFKMQFLPNE
jgi:hypothetical protein